METVFLTSVFVSLLAVHSSDVSRTVWDDIVVAEEGSYATLVCIDKTVGGAVAVNWMLKSSEADQWKLLLSADRMKQFSGVASKHWMGLIDPNFQESGVFSLGLYPKLEDGGLYSCLVRQQGRKVKEKIILLSVLRVQILPSPVVTQQSTLQLSASVQPDVAVSKITWSTPHGTTMKSEKNKKSSTEAKLPRLQSSEGGIYVCTVSTWNNNNNNSTSSVFRVRVDIANKTVSIGNVKHSTPISTATQALTPITLSCPDDNGDYVLLYWQQTEKHSNMTHIFLYDRWRDSTSSTVQPGILELAGPPYNAEAGSFAFRLTPDVTNGGLYICDVYLNDEPKSLRTEVSVLKVEAKHSSSKVTLKCRYSAVSQVHSSIWTHQDKGRTLKCSSVTPGVVTTTVPLPVTSDTAGNYTCTLRLKNGKTVWATHAVTLPPKDGRNVNASAAHPSLLLSLSALLLLVPLAAAAVGVLLWKRKQISDCGIEQSLSVRTGDAENIYENPEELKEASPQSSVYMDLKPRGEDDVYKELER
ncbi:g6f-like isoform X2 [Cynoglossus semilaevis]|uniref:g6f-like isoform X2 n=1 Tax=Cynoglossus semilaevis TaxID=244447 RepID=UPI000D623FD6|nr:uncharacterized protein LOC103387987 isoform X2 [Cynoglossus semilaevis]